ncbi:MAG TPA: cation:proton antiporter, partial [Candidatus Magasanikbacteria bacterium]|nr:cation:proton antiporter [Candidatus Magasanikbacteria bacterium]
MEDVFIQITLLLVLTVVIAFSVRLFKQPLIIAYIITGMVCGPLFLNLLHGQERMYEVFAQFGVVLLLFIIGLNLNFNHLKNIGKTSLVAGLGQVLFTGIIGTLILLAMKVPLLTSVYLAVAITFSSTII